MHANTPTHAAWVAYAIIFPVLLLALVTSPIWMGAFGALKLMKAFKRRVEIAVKARGHAGAASSDRTDKINGTTILVPDLWSGLLSTLCKTESENAVPRHTSVAT